VIYSSDLLDFAEFLGDQNPNHVRKYGRRVNSMERLNQEIRRRTKSIGAFPDGQSALMLVCAKLRYIDQSEWGKIPI
jgi:transposase-like protein